MAGRGGKREGAGRKPKADEKKVNTIMLTALRELHKKETDDEAKIAFIKDLYESQRGQIFIAEHLFGKPKEIVENTVKATGITLKDLINFDNSEQ